MTSTDATSTAHSAYRERLTPSLWAFVSAAVVAPMAAMVFVPFDKTVALAAGVVVAVLVIALLIAAAPRVEVRGAELRAGRAHIPVAALGEAEPFAGEDARQLRGPGLQRDAWHLIRGGIDGLIQVPVTDPQDPTPVWVISSRTPDRLAAAIRRAQRAASATV
ncbi:DUF3093 domain-containing protein [Microbacterium protaetiae]|uniref:DUF3093 domain-containing protein n=1 Tax=Microbacterium protaetiae TaxID=2509458 RepID=A0A4P6EG85_9MICO|nr:DUF3093 domain-containing protein [Microbacterium protaetiae]QAY61305.1 DUF3093 domain-containing protein [Microbacterium protaetiae]